MNDTTHVTNPPVEAELSIAYSSQEDIGPVAQDTDDTLADPVLAAFDDWVRRTPQAIAVDDHGEQWSYARLSSAADAVAEALRPRVRPGDIVGMCLGHSALLAAATVALARLGAVQILLGPQPAANRLLALTEAVRLTCVLGEPGDALPLARSAVDVPAPDGAATATRLDVHTPPQGTAVAADTEGARYAVLTSGSTGAPKVVLVGAASLARVVRWYRGRADLRPGDRQALFMHTAFDAHFMEFWGGLSAGATLVVAPREARSDPAALTDWWTRADITATLLPAPLGETVLDRPWPRDQSLRYLCIGGDRLRRWPAADVTAQVDNVYGPSETTIGTTFHPLDPAEAGSVDAPPIGRPLAGAVAYVTDGAGAVVPRGTAGELRIGGPVLALGYLDKELTARRFPASPAEGGAGGRAYRTGDRVVMRTDGVLEFLGRLDDQLKISGIRIEPAEIEAALERDERVSRAVVASRGGDKVVAFVLPAPGAEPDEAELLAHAARWLPPQVVPSRVRVVGGFPYDANGKVDRKALLAQEEPRTDAQAGEAASRLDGAETEQERRVLAHCRTILDNPDLGLDDNFRDAGGSSIDIARLLVALEKDSGVRLRAPQVMRQPDLRRVAALLGPRPADTA
ncbi:non-ribosomal peptide synthetase [Streptomyces sp. NPDC048297]|uniref:non-ribosomal peptide synthetase n=1 Tax=Streptomyces sp. NPDC048297 TaxID=3365531 RepID=UPI0037108DEF